MCVALHTTQSWRIPPSPPSLRAPGINRHLATRPSLVVNNESCDPGNDACCKRHELPAPGPGHPSNRPYGDNRIQHSAASAKCYRRILHPILQKHAWILCHMHGWGSALPIPSFLRSVRLDESLCLHQSAIDPTGRFLVPIKPNLSICETRLEFRKRCISWCTANGRAWRRSSFSHRLIRHAEPYR